jgi:triosephosphate isomerase|tara:strand:- start:169 stop:936 length:768 start_codon:yes stop_codon:yes gene_type:complete
MSYPLVIANWKMNIPSGGISGWIQNEMISNNDEVDFENKSSYLRFMGIAPPISHLTELKNLFNFGFLGAQDISKYNDGAKTGDISADMVIEKGCSFSILGHSERREFYNETNSIVSEKLRVCLEKSIIPVVCIGESLEDYNAGKTLDILEMQLKEIFTSIATKKTVVIAYEPVWAIGSGKTPSTVEVNNIHQHIKDIVQSIANIEAVNVIYGGSVNCENAKSFFQQTNIDGALIGGASLDGKDFLGIYNDFMETL